MPEVVREPPLLPSGTCPPQPSWEIAESLGRTTQKVPPRCWWLCNLLLIGCMVILVGIWLAGKLFFPDLRVLTGKGNLPAYLSSFTHTSLCIASGSNHLITSFACNSSSRPTTTITTTYGYLYISSFVCSCSSRPTTTLPLILLLLL